MDKARIAAENRCRVCMFSTVTFCGKFSNCVYDSYCGTRDILLQQCRALCGGKDVSAQDSRKAVSKGPKEKKKKERLPSWLKKKQDKEGGGRHVGAREREREKTGVWYRAEGGLPPSGERDEAPPASAFVINDVSDDNDEEKLLFGSAGNSRESSLNVGLVYVEHSGRDEDTDAQSYIAPQMKTYKKDASNGRPAAPPPLLSQAKRASPSTTAPPPLLSQQQQIGRENSLGASSFSDGYGGDRDQRSKQDTTAFPTASTRKPPPLLSQSRSHRTVPEPEPSEVDDSEASSCVQPVSAVMARSRN